MIRSPFAARRPGVKPARKAITTALVAAIFSTVLGAVGVAPSAQAADGNPTFNIGNDDRDGYWGFINHIRSVVNQNQANYVPGTNEHIEHTGTGGAGSMNPADYFQVDLHEWDAPQDRFLRLQIRRSDLYVVGWWDWGNMYNAAEPSPSVRMREGQMIGAWGTRNPGFGANYGRIEGWAGINRNDIHYNRATVNEAVRTLLGTDDRNSGTQSQARAFLMMTQFVSEAARFRPISDLMGFASNGWDTQIDGRLVGMENNWDAVSQRYNRLRARAESEHNNNVTDTDPMRAYWRDTGGSVREIVLWNLINFAMVLNVAKHQ
jgi:hypothetical protein